MSLWGFTSPFLVCGRLLVSLHNSHRLEFAFGGWCAGVLPILVTALSQPSNAVWALRAMHHLLDSMSPDEASPLQCRTCMPTI